MSGLQIKKFKCNPPAHAAHPQHTFKYTTYLYNIYSNIKYNIYYTPQLAMLLSLNKRVGREGIRGETRFSKGFMILINYIVPCAIPP